MTLGTISEPDRPGGSDLRAVVITEDGQQLTGRGWVTPIDYLEDDIAAGRLVALKGATPTELPTLDDRNEEQE